MLFMPCIGDQNGTFVIDLASFSPGPHSLTVTATTDDGEEDAVDIINFFVPEPLGQLRQ